MVLRYVEDVAGLGCWQTWNRSVDLSVGNVRGNRHLQGRRFNGLSAAAARDAGRRTSAVFPALLLVSRARLGDDERVGP